MRTLIIGIEHPFPRRLIEDDRLTSVRSLMESGWHGRIVELGSLDRASLWRTVISGVSDGGNARGTAIEDDSDATPTLPTLLGTVGVDPLLIDAARIGPVSDPHDKTDRYRLLSMSRQRFKGLQERLETLPWTYAQLFDDGPARLLDLTGSEAVDDWGAMLNEALAAILDRLDDELSILLLAVPGPIEGGPVRPEGAFVLASSRGVPAGHVEEARLVDFAPTLMLLAGREVPDTFEGLPIGVRGGGRIDDEAAVLERLRGLGYID